MSFFSFRSNSSKPTYKYTRTPQNYLTFFKNNGLLKEENIGTVFRIEGSGGETAKLKVKKVNDEFKVYSEAGYDVSSSIIQKYIYTDKTNIRGRDGSTRSDTTVNDYIVNMIVVSSGGRKASVKKEICGRLRCIYKIPGSRKEHIKYKGRLITVEDYKNLKKKA
jgi:hypothetical protein